MRISDWSSDVCSSDLAPVLQVTALAGARVEERAEAVGGFGRAGRGHPELAEDAVADPKVELALEAHIGGRLGEDAAIDRLERGRGAAGIELVGFGGREIRRRLDHRRHPVAVRLRPGRGTAGSLPLCRADGAG